MFAPVVSAPARFAAAALLALALIAGCGSIQPVDDDAGTDAGPDDPDAGIDAGAEDPDATPGGPPWVTVKRIDELSSDAADWAPTMRDDGREIIFASNRVGNQFDLYVATRGGDTGKWSDPTRIDIFRDGGTAWEVQPVLSRDGKTLWLSSNRPGGRGGYDIYVTTRATTSSAWPVPERVTELSSPNDDFPGTVIDSELAMVLTSDRARGGGGAGYDLYMASRDTTASRWSTIEDLVELNTVATPEAGGALSADLLRLYYVTNFPGTGSDIVVSERTSVTEDFGPPHRIDALSSPQGETQLFVSSDQRVIMFSSNRGGAGEDLYQGTR